MTGAGLPGEIGKGNTMKITCDAYTGGEEELREVLRRFLALFCSGRLALSIVPRVGDQGEVETEIGYKPYGDKPWKWDTRFARGTNHTVAEQLLALAGHPDLERPLLEAVRVATDVVITCSCGERFSLGQELADQDRVDEMDEGTIGIAHPLFTHLERCPAFSPEGEVR
jgi:hypothetical protein